MGQMAPVRTYTQIVASQFKRNKLAVLSLNVIYVLLFIFIFADFLANDKPIVMHYKGETYFPVFREYGVNILGWNWQDEFKTQQFKILEDRYEAGDWAIYPVIPYSPNEYNLEVKLQPPGLVHLFGTDELGRDVLSQMIHGARVSLLVGFVAVAIYVVIGILLGALAGFYGGMIDIIIQRMIEIMITFPRMFLIITIVAVMETQ